LLSADVLVLAKIAVWNSYHWRPEELANELEITPEFLMESLDRLKLARLIHKDTHKVSYPDFQDFILFGLHYCFPASPGKITRGMLTGVKPGMFFTSGLHYTSITVWPHELGKHEGYEVVPLAPFCYQAALNDSRLRELLAVTETMRVVGREARAWAAYELKRILEIKD
jgi:hypothetical protein